MQLTERNHRLFQHQSTPAGYAGKPVACGQDSDVPGVQVRGDAPTVDYRPAVRGG